MSLARHTTAPQIVEVPVPVTYRPTPVAVDFPDRPLATERRSSYQGQLDLSPHPRLAHRTLTYDGTELARPLNYPRPLLHDAEERDHLARDINRLKEQEARDYIMSQDMRGERLRKEHELRSIERRELERRLSRGIIDEEMDRLNSRDRLERLQRVVDSDRHLDGRRLEDKMRNMRIDDLERRNSYGIGGYNV